MNKGLDLEKEELEQDGSEWTFGAVSQPGLANIPEDEREQYLPKGELQSGKEDFMDCVTRGYLNSLETQFNYLLRNDKLEPENVKWLESKGYIDGGNVTFSDRFIAILSGTTRQGNSLKAPIDTIRKQGLIPKSILPKGDFTWNEYHDPTKITPEMKQLGQDFLKRFSINYEQVPKVLMSQSVKDDIVVVAGYAWPTPIDGIYPPSPNLPFNHCFINFKNQYFAYDNYLDNGKPEDWIKHLSEFYEFYTYGYRAYISKETVPTFEDLQDFQRIPLFTWLANMIAWIFTRSGPMPEIPKEILPEKPIEKPVVPTPKPESKYRWDDQEDVRHSLRVIGDEYGLTWLQKDLLCDICRCESLFKPTATLENSPKSIDRGLFQWNSYWHPHITDEIAYDPEKNTRLACQALLEGKAKTYWSASMKCWNKGGKYNSIL